MKTEANWEWVDDTDLRPGDIVKSWFGHKTVARIEPYRGPYDFVTGIAVMFPSSSPKGCEMSLCKGQTIQRLKP